MRPHQLLAALYGLLCFAASPGARGDDGGPLQAYIADVQRLNQRGGSYRIEGRCASACTVYLGARKVCVEPSADLWFHAAYRPGASRPDAAGSLQMLAMYPPAVRRWAIASGALEQTAWRPEHRLSGTQLIRMGVPRCAP